MLQDYLRLTLKLLICQEGSIILEIEILPDLTGNSPDTISSSFRIRKTNVHLKVLYYVTGNVTKDIKEFQLVSLPQTDRVVLNLVDNLVSHSSLTMCNYVDDSTGLYDCFRKL